MFDHYTIKAAPAVSHKEILKKIQEATDFDPDELAKLQHLKVKIEAVCHPGDFKKLNDLLKDLSKKG